MLWMAFEREVVLNIHHHIEIYEQQQLFDENVDEADIPSEVEFNHSHIRLGLCQWSLKLHTYEKVLEEELKFQNFGDSLTEFLCNYAGVDVHGSHFKRDGFEGHQHCVFHCKVPSFLAWCHPHH